MEYDTTIRKGELLFHGSPFDFDIIESFKNERRTLFYSFNPILALAILTEKIEKGYGFIYCLRVNEDVTLPEEAFSFVPPLFFHHPQNVGDTEGRFIWEKRGEAHKWDPKELIREPIEYQQEVVIPTYLIPSCTLLSEDRIDVCSLREIVRKYETEEEIILFSLGRTSFE